MTVHYTLFKKPVQLDTLAVIQYLHHLGKDFRPSKIIERNHADWVTQLPSIRDEQTGLKYIGLENCVNFWERSSQQKGLLQRSLSWKASNPQYRVNGY